MSAQDKDFFNSHLSFSISGKDVDNISNKTSTSSDNEINALVQTIENKFHYPDKFDEEEGIGDEIFKNMQTNAIEILSEVQREKNKTSSQMYEEDVNIFKSDKSNNDEIKSLKNVENIEDIIIPIKAFYAPNFIDRLLKFIKKITEGTEFKSKKITSAYEEEDVKKKIKKVKKIIDKVKEILDTENKAILNTYIKGLVMDVNSKTNEEKKFIMKKKVVDDNENFQRELITFNQHYDSDRIINKNISKVKFEDEFKDKNKLIDNIKSNIGIEIKIDCYDESNTIEKEIQNYSIKQNLDFVKKFNKKNGAKKSRASSKFSDRTKNIYGSDKLSNETSTKKNSDLSNNNNNSNSGKFKKQNLQIKTCPLTNDCKRISDNLPSKNLDINYNTHTLQSNFKFDFNTNNKTTTNNKVLFYDKINR